MITSLLALVLIGSDPIGVVNVDNANSNLPFFLTRHPVTTNGVGVPALGSVGASLQKFYKGTGKKAVQFAFAADRDGDGGDEIVVVRGETPALLKDLRVVRAPTKIAAGSPKVLASTKKNDPAFDLAAAPIVAMGRFDADGDGKDGVAIVRDVGEATYAVEIRALPSGKNKALGAVTGTMTVGPLAAGLELFQIFGAPLDATLGDELVVVTHAHGVAFYSSGSFVSGGTYVAAGSTELLGLGVVTVVPARVTFADMPGMLILRDDAGTRRIETRALADGAIELDAATPYAGVPVFAAFALREASPPPQPGDDTDPQFARLEAGFDDLTIAVMKVKFVPGVSPVTFTDNVGKAVTIVSGGGPPYTDWWPMYFTPSTFTWKLAEVGPAPGNFATLSVTIPGGAGVSGFLADGCWIAAESSDGTSMGTVTISGQTSSVNWIRFFGP